MLTAKMVAAATRGQLVAGDGARVFSTVSIDTRTLAPGALYIALRGERLDGHTFVGHAIGGGATGAVVSRVPDTPVGDAALILVDDTLAALQRLARHVRRQSGARVIAITGSAGKTTTKEVTADLLATKFRVFRNRGNLNNHVGLPLSLLELRDGPDIAVVELGMNHAGEIRALVAIAEPDVRVWTNVGDAHIGAFHTREAIAAAKAEILEGASPSTLVVANADDPLVMQAVRGSLGRPLTFGESPEADIRAGRVVDRGFDGTEADVHTPFGQVALRVPLAGRANLSNVLAAMTVALDAGIALDTMAARIRALRPVARRGEVVALSRGVRLVDDSYNASPAATRQALRSLAATATPGRRVAVLGEMLELGDRARDLHDACGRTAADAGVDVLVAVGGADAEGLIAGARAGGLRDSQLLRFADSRQAAAAIAGLVRDDDLVLVKGSRGTRMDLVADRLKERG